VVGFISIFHTTYPQMSYVNARVEQKFVLVL
jgi:hypothetical protein